MQTMAGFSQPPTHSMREEWKRLSGETRRAALDLVFSRARPSDAEILEQLQTLGLSPELATWIVDEALGALIQAQRQLFEKRMEVVSSRTSIDYFNRLLLSLGFLLLMLTWLVQDSNAARTGAFPVSLPFAALLSFVAWSAFLGSLRRWMRSLRK